MEAMPDCQGPSTAVTSMLSKHTDGRKGMKDGQTLDSRKRSRDVRPLPFHGVSIGGGGSKQAPKDRTRSMDLTNGFGGFSDCDDTSILL